MQASDTTAGTLESLHATVEELCCQYNHRDALELRQDARGWLQHIGGLLRRPVGLKAHGDLLVAGGWLALLAGCVEYDLGMRTAAESTRTAAMQLGLEAGHSEIAGWGHEMTAWFDHLPYPDRPDNHFKVDPAKWDYYAMDVHRFAGATTFASSASSVSLAIGR